MDCKEADLEAFESNLRAITQGRVLGKTAAWVSNLCPNTSDLHGYWLIGAKTLQPLGHFAWHWASPWTEASYYVAHNLASYSVYIIYSSKLASGNLALIEY